jgi:hypothetical protein
VSAPVLPLNAANIASVTNCGIVAAWMLFPDEAKLRECLIRRRQVEERFEQYLSGELGPMQVPDLILRAMEATPIDELNARRDERVARAYGAGMILYNSGIAISRGDRAPVGAATKDVGKAIWGREHSASKHVNDKVWRTYRPVAALWAAFIHFENDNEELPLPCEPTDLLQFLTVAEAFRKKGEELSPPHRKHILEPGQSVGLSPEVLAMMPCGTLTIVNRSPPT